MNETELKSGFYNAVLVEGEPDRTYNADDINDFLEGLVSNSGVYATVSTACQVLAGTGMQVIIKAGKGIVDNHWFKIESDVTLDIDAADVILNRIDSIVVQHSNTDRKIKLYVKSGALATSPVAPALTRNEEVYEICLANILVNKNVTSITTSMITDTRPNDEVCGWIVGVIKQIDTTTLYNQYETAQNEFINEQQEEFKNWFTDIQDDVKATNLYREYQAVYTSQTKGEQVITIPSSINYVHNGLDVLNIFINGMRLLKDVEYTISSDGNSVNLAFGLDVVGTDVEFVNKKSVEGTIAESTVLRVEAVEQKVADLSECSYIATGTDDNIKLSNIVKNFLDGTSGELSNASLRINVTGILNISTLIDDQMAFDFHSTNNTDSARRAIINFGNATIPVLSNSDSINIFAMFGANNDVIIENANVLIGHYNANTIYGFHGGIVKDSKLGVANGTANTIYGCYSCKEVSNSEITMLTTGTGYGIFASDKVLFNNVDVLNGTSIQGKSNSIMIGNFVNISPVVNGATEIGTIII